MIDLERKGNINTADQPMLDQAMRLIGVDAGDSSAITASILDWIDRDKNEHRRRRGKRLLRKSRSALQGQGRLHG